MINFQNQLLPVTLTVLEGSTETRYNRCEPYAIEQEKITLDYVCFKVCDCLFSRHKFAGVITSDFCAALFRVCCNSQR